MRLIVYLGNYQTAQRYLSSSTMCYPKWASRSAGNVSQINQHLNEAVGTVWSRAEPSQIESHLGRPLCQFEEHAAEEEHTCATERRIMGFLLGHQATQFTQNTHSRPRHTRDRHLPQSRASLMAF